MAASEEDMNIVRDQLVKNGFDVKLNIQPDYGSFSAQKKQVFMISLFQAGRQLQGTQTMLFVVYLKLAVTTVWWQIQN